LEATADGIKILFLISKKSDEINLRRKEVPGSDRYLEDGGSKAYLKDMVTGRHYRQNGSESEGDRSNESLIGQEIC